MFFVFKFLHSKKSKNIFAAICKLFNGNTNSKKTFQAYDF